MTFCAAMARLNNGKRLHGSQSLKHLLSGSLQENLLTLVLDILLWLFTKILTCVFRDSVPPFLVSPYKSNYPKYLHVRVVFRSKFLVSCDHPEQLLLILSILSLGFQAPFSILLSRARASIFLDALIFLPPSFLGQTICAPFFANFVCMPCYFTKRVL